jgi:hypothetical protein
MSRIEQIDDFLSNQLSEAERAAFEQQMAGDSTLRSEVEMQRAIIEGIKNARVAELKAMLNKVPVAGGGASFNFSPIRLAAGIMAVGVITVAMYHYLKPETMRKAAADVVTQPEKQVQQLEVQEQPQAPETAPIASEKDEQAQPKTRRQQRKAEPAQQPAIHAVDPSDELSTPDAERLPAPAEVSASIAVAKLDVVVDSSHKKFDRHYRFSDGKLLLYGNFKDTYEILEVHGASRSLFLVYQEQYYLLDEAKRTTTRLQPVAEGPLLNKLREFQRR